MNKGVFNNRLDLFDDPDYEINEPDAVVSPIGNALPIMFNAQAPRALYGSKFFEQALPTTNRQAPLVRNLHSGSGRSWDFELGKSLGAVFAPADGTVRKVTDDELTIDTADGKTKVVDLYNKYPFNRNTLIHNKALLKAGDTFKAGQALASSNFTDDEGRMALGVNGRIAVVPFEGKTMDDATVISESFARRLTSDHANMIDLEDSEGAKTGKGHYVALFHKKYNQEQLKNIGDDGYIKPGSILNPGDPIRLATKPKTFRSDAADIKNLSRAARFTRKDDSAVWDGDDPAEVLDVVKSRKGDVRLLVRYESPARPGDKLTLRNGQKATITEVIPDDRMPSDAEGRKMEMLLNQLGLPSRVNSATYFEMMLGKIAEHTGKAYTIPYTFPDKKPMNQFVAEELEKNGVAPNDVLFDPRLGRNLDQPVATGNGHVLKLHHTAKKKIRYRGKGSYDINHQPLKGGDDGGGAQRLSGLEMSVLHSSGARGIQKEAILLRGEHRPEYWRAIRENRPPPTLGKPFVWDKFLALLQGAGVNAKDFGNGKLRLTPVTDKHVDGLRAVEIKNGKLIDHKTMEPVGGGLFDPDMMRDQSWGKISLPLSMINPAYESQVRMLLGLKQKELDALLDRAPGLLGDQEKKAAIEDVRSMLESLDLEAMKAQALADVRSGKKTKRAGGVKMLRAISGIQRAGVTPQDLVITRVPVIPAGFRPYTVSGDTFLPGDANELYADVMKAKDIYQEALDELGAEGASDARDYLRKAVRAAYGYEDSPNVKLKARRVGGFFKKIIGTNPKQSWVQSKLISKPQDHVGRAVISPDPKLTMDQLGIPEDMAWELGKDHVEGRLTSHGIDKARRLKLIADRHPIARAALEQELSERPMVYSRAPAWHKQNVISGYARIVKGNNIRISPLVSAGLNADYDGDCQFSYIQIRRRKSGAPK